MKLPRSLLIMARSEGGEIGIDHGYLKKLYGRVKSWLLSQETRNSGKILDGSIDQRHLVVIDDASSLATIFGRIATEMFIRQVRSLLRQ